MGMNIHWPRWTWASVSKHFKNIIETNNQIKLFIEGQDIVDRTLNTYTEFRMDGPYIKQLSRREYDMIFEINILITSFKDTKDGHKLQRLNGIVASAFIECIPIFKYGPSSDLSNGDPVNDNSRVSELILKTDKREIVQVSNFGTIEVDIPIMQASVEGHYKGRYKL